MLGCMEEQIRHADQARVEAMQSKQTIEQEFNNLKKVIKTATAASGS